MCDGVRTELITFICFITALNTNEAFAATAGRLPVIGAVSRVLTFRNYDTADEEKEIHMEIPQIQEPEAGSTSSPLAADVNKEIETIMEAYRRDAQQRICLLYTSVLVDLSVPGDTSVDDTAIDDTAIDDTAVSASLAAEIRDRKQIIRQHAARYLVARKHVIRKLDSGETVFTVEGI